MTLELKAFKPSQGTGPHEQVKEVSDPATAAYNFIPLPEAVLAQSIASVPSHDRLHKGRLSGRIDCVIETMQPVYVRGAWTPEEYETHQGQREAKSEAEHWALMRNKPQPFAHGATGRPRLPARTLRGMIRAVLAQASYAQPDRISQRQLSYRPIGDSSSLAKEYMDRFLHRHPLNADDRKYERDAHIALGPGVPFGVTKMTPLVRAGYVERVNDAVFIRPARTLGATTMGPVSFFRVKKEAVAEFLRLRNRPSTTHHCRVFFRPGKIEFFEHGTKRDGNGFPWKRLRIEYAEATALRSDADPSSNSMTEGTLVCTGGIGDDKKRGNKKLQYVFNAPDENATPLEVPPAAVGELRMAMADSTPVSDADPHPRESLFDEEGRLRDGVPVFYLPPKEPGKPVERFGWTMMFRLAYRSQIPKEFLPDYSADQHFVDLAQGLFGWAPTRTPT